MSDWRREDRERAIARGNDRVLRVFNALKAERDACGWGTSLGALHAVAQSGPAYVNAVWRDAPGVPVAVAQRIVEVVRANRLS